MLIHGNRWGPKFVLWVLAVCVNAGLGAWANEIDQAGEPLALGADISTAAQNGLKESDQAGEAIAIGPEFPVLRPPSPELPSPPQPPAAEKVQRFVLEGGPLDQLGEEYEEFKQRQHMPVTFGAWNWWHVNTGGPLATGYGIPSTTNSAYPALPGTYNYTLEASPEFECNVWPFTKAGVYSDVRFRDSGVPMRPFYASDTWLQQGYAWGLTDFGVFKVGDITRRFGLDWDGTWWGNVAYFDGFKISSAWGLSWEATTDLSERFRIDHFLQFFLHNNLDGSLVGADPDSVIGSSERNMLVGRAVPTLQLSKNESLALGISGLYGQIENRSALALAGLPLLSFASPGNQTQSAWAVDATYTNGRLKVFGEALQSYGVLSPSNYVSFGPSSRLTDAEIGVHWTEGPVTYRCCYSMGFYDNPSGLQQLLVPGVTLAMTRNTEIYMEYAYQEVRHSGSQSFTTLENGMQFLLHVHF
jgi:hypothetical protein